MTTGNIRIQDLTAHHSRKSDLEAKLPLRSYMKGRMKREQKPAWRRCLGGCRKEFWSSGPGNRICEKCKRRRCWGDEGRTSRWERR